MRSMSVTQIILIFQWKDCMVQENICTTKQNNDAGHTDTVLYYTMNIKAVWKVFIVTYSETNVTIFSALMLISTMAS